MRPMKFLPAIVWTFVLTKWAAQVWLEIINQRHSAAHAATTSEESVKYTLAKSRLHLVEAALENMTLLAVLFSGILPWFYRFFTGAAGQTIWAQAGFLCATGFVLSLLELPLEWHSQFHLEQRFGFNTTTPALWWSDRLKAGAISLALAWPLLALILKLYAWMGAVWWLWAWGCVIAFQLVALVLAPVIILPLFNKFSPLPEGELRDKLLSLGKSVQFPARDIQVMDGSKRSRHSNAFFTGLGRFRKIVLFDTLVQQLGVSELEAVLAHEIGHYKKKHIPRMLAASTILWLGAFYFLAVMLRQPEFYGAFGFRLGETAPMLFV
jgi:STE24 endopeptidase